MIYKQTLNAVATSVVTVIDGIIFSVKIEFKKPVPSVVLTESQFFLLFPEAMEIVINAIEEEATARQNEDPRL